MSGFHDHFSTVSLDYQRYRPVYPAILFAELAALAPEKHLAWDCGAGSGQATTGLLEHFAMVLASDASTSQIQSCRVPGAWRFCALAEAAPLADQCVDLITVAQAVHWFDLDRFYAEVRRVLKPGGVLAVWTYRLMNSTPELDEIIFRLYSETLGQDWPEQRRLVEGGYADLPFPFEEVSLPQRHMSAHWDLDAVMGYLATWSAVGRYQKRTGKDPLPCVRDELLRRWPEGLARVHISWPVAMRAGRLK